MTLLTVIFTVMGLSSCSSWDPEYVQYDKEGATVSVEFLPDLPTLPDGESPAQFDSKASVTVVDVFNPNNYTADGNGNISITIYDPTDTSVRGNRAKTLDKTGHLFMGWYVLNTSTDDNGNTVYSYGEKWDLKTNKLTIKQNGSYTSSEPQLTLVAKWAPFITYRFLYQNELGEWTYMMNGEEEIKKSAITVTLPFWDNNGKLQYVDFPKRSGFTFLGAYYDEEMTDAVVGEVAGEYGADGEPVNSVVDVYTTWREGDWVKIFNVAQLRNVAANSCIDIMADLDFNGALWPTALATGTFTGKINGNGHTISRVTVNGASSKAGQVYIAGLFGTIAEGAEITNLTFDNVTYNVKQGRPSSKTTFALFSANQLSENITDVTVTNSKIVLTFDFLNNFGGDLTREDGFEVYTFVNGKSDGITKNNVKFEIEAEKEGFGDEILTVDVTVTEDSETGKLTFSYPVSADS